MEQYRIVANCINNSTFKVLGFLPENFEGVKITQKFSFQNPIGYTPAFSLDTMKTIKGDKTWLDNIFDTYGLQSDVTFQINKLNTTATAYAFKANFKVDFESYLMFDDYSEFALKSDSCIDEYNEAKNSPQNFTGAAQVALPTTQNYINYVSVKKKLAGGVSLGNHLGYLELEENNDSKIYNDDMAMYWQDQDAYEFRKVGGGTVDLSLIATGSLLINFTFAGTTVIYVKLYKNDHTDSVLILGEREVSGDSSTTIEIQIDKTKVEDVAFDHEDFLFIGIEAEDTGLVIDEITGELSLELYVQTDLTANPYSRKLYYFTSETILDAIFNDQATIETALKSIGVTSSQSILRRQNFISTDSKRLFD
jgi:hypothetical protein